MERCCELSRIGAPPGTKAYISVEKIPATTATANRNNYCFHRLAQVISSNAANGFGAAFRFVFDDVVARTVFVEKRNQPLMGVRHLSTDGADHRRFVYPLHLQSSDWHGVGWRRRVVGGHFS